MTAILFGALLAFVGVPISFVLIGIGIYLTYAIFREVF